MKHLKSAKKKLDKTKQKFNDKHPFVVPLVTFAGLLVVSIFGFLFFGGSTVNPNDTKVITLHVDESSQTIPTRATTVRDFLERAEIELSDKDLVEPSLDSPILTEKFTVNIYRAKPVTVIDENGKKIVANIADTSPEVMASQAGFKLFPEDIIEIEEPDQSLQEGIIGPKVVINRATPIKMNLYGKTYAIRTHAETVDQLVEERNISVDENSVLPKLGTALKKNDVVFITNPGKKIAVVEEIIPNDEEVIYDQGLEVGQEQVRREGSAGRKAVVYEIGPNGARTALNEVIISKPVTRVVVQGRKSSAPNVSVAGDQASLMLAAGIPADQHASASFIIGRESGWRPAARSASGCIGLGQRCNASILINACPNWETDAVCQLQHFNGYAVGRYGSWNEAYSFWQVNHWW